MFSKLNHILGKLIDWTVLNRKSTYLDDI